MCIVPELLNLKFTAALSDNYRGETYLTQIALNNVPLIHINAPGCPTCESLLATGHGIENADSAELRKSIVL